MEIAPAGTPFRFRSIWAGALGFLQFRERTCVAVDLAWGDAAPGPQRRNRKKATSPKASSHTSVKPDSASHPRRSSRR